MNPPLDGPPSGTFHAPAPKEADPAEGPDWAAERKLGPLSPFRYPIFRALWWASLASNFGWMIQSVATSWLMASIGASAELIALVQASISLPIMLFALTAGAIADNFDRRKLMLASQIFMLAVAIGLAICTYVDFVTPWLLLAFTFLLSSGAAIYGPAWQSIVGEILPRFEIPSAVAVNAMGFNIARSVGPAIGGIVLTTSGPFASFVVNALSYTALIAVLICWRQPERPRALPPERLGSAIVAGIRYVALSPQILAVLLRGAAFGLAASCFQALLPLVARDIIRSGPLTFGLLLGAFGIGAVSGALFATYLRRALSLEGSVRLAFLGFALAAAVAGLSSSAILTASGALIGGASFVIVLSSLNATVQLSTPRWVVGRALAIYQMATFGAMALGSWVWGNITERFDVSSALLASAALLVFGSALGLRFGLTETKSFDLDPVACGKEPEVALSAEQRSGPITITIEYLIREENVGQFLAIMKQLKRIRRRDGAQRWTLLRDVVDTQLWIERYQSPTWLDYIRHTHRATRTDILLNERLLELHEGDDEPRIRRSVELFDLHH